MQYIELLFRSAMSLCRLSLSFQQTEILQQVFVTYFRILKHAPRSPLITPAMEGLARYTLDKGSTLCEGM